jgi:very-short-patch-repair endonuclease
MIHNLLPILIIVLLFVVIAVVVKIVLTQRAQEPQSYPYEKEQAFFSPAERSFLGVLEQAVNGRYRFMGKVRLADIIKVKSGMNKSAWQNAFNRIQSKHVDIVACDPATLNVQFVVELDDSTHAQSGRQNRDQFVDNALRAAGIPIVHVNVRTGYTLQDIQNILSEVGAATKM